MKPVCPKCGHPVVRPATIGLNRLGSKWICPMNMPFYGCGWAGNLSKKEA